MAVGIVFGHIFFHGKFQTISADIIGYKALDKISFGTGTVIVFMFFMISGFFLYNVLEKYRAGGFPKFTEFFKSKYVRFMPAILATAVIVIIYALCADMARPLVESFPSLPFQITLTEMIQTGKGFHGGYAQGFLFDLSSWFVQVLFWISMLYFALAKNISRNMFNILFGILTFVAMKNIFGDPIFGIQNQWFRGLGYIGVGYFIGYAYNALDLGRRNLGGTVSEVLLLGVFITMLCCSHRPSGIILLVFGLLFVVFIQGRGKLSQLLNRPIFGFLGAASYSVYICHGVVIAAARPILSKNIEFLNNNLIPVVIGIILASYALGILIYRFIERPIGALCASDRRTACAARP